MKQVVRLQTGSHPRKDTAKPQHRKQDWIEGRRIEHIGRGTLMVWALRDLRRENPYGYYEYLESKGVDISVL
jgi:hypothetical protein